VRLQYMYNCRKRTAGTGQSEWTIRTGQPEQAGQNGTTRTGQLEWDRQSGTGRAGQAELNRQNTKQAELDCQDRTVRTGLLGEDSEAGQKGEDSHKWTTKTGQAEQGRTGRQDSQNRTGRTEQAELGCQDKTAKRGQRRRQLEQDRQNKNANKCQFALPHSFFWLHAQQFERATSVHLSITLSGAMMMRPHFMCPCKGWSLDYRSLFDMSILVKNKSGLCVLY
jgi:hypothetical protein